MKRPIRQKFRKHRCQLPPKFPATPHMSKDELKLFDRYLAGANSYLEFGIGGSSAYILKNYPNLSLFLVETNKRFCQMFAGIPLVQQKMRKGTCTVRHVDIGLTGEWGTPKFRSDQAKWLNYTIGFWPGGPKDIDLVLVDGRFRLCTALLALLYLENGIFLFHDFINRAYYHPLLKYVNVMDMRDTLIAYRKNEHIDTKSIMNDISKCILDYR